jgi:nucleoside-diphosphate-sugar epimerase
MADACIRAGERREAAKREFNIAGPQVATIEEMCQMIREAAFPFSGPRRKSFLKTRRENQRYDTTKAEMFLGFTPRITLPHGLAEILASAETKRSNESRLPDVG